MKMQLPIHVPEEITIEDSASVSVSETVTDSQITVTKNDSCVPDSHMKFIVQKVAELLDSQGIPCCHCSKTRYILSPLSACKDIFNTFTLNIICPYGNAAYRFELSVSPGDESAQKMPAVAEPSALKGGEQTWQTAIHRDFLHPKKIHVFTTPISFYADTGMQPTA